MGADPSILVIGAGMSGLACARTIADRGGDVRIVESSDRVGGRLGSVRTDDVVCDLGFQVTMSNYTTLESLVSLEAAPRRDFDAGAVVVTDRLRTRILDPARHPLASLSPLAAGFVKPRDLLAAIRFRRDAGDVAAGGHRTGTAARYLDTVRFSPAFRAGFLDPFFAGVMLDETLDVPADRLLRTAHRFATGRAQLPVGGMQAIADAMAASILDRIDFGVAAESIVDGVVRLSDGATIAPDRIVLATSVDATRRLLGLETLPADRVWSSTTAVHFRTTAALPTDRLITLDGRASSPLNLACIPTAIADGYAPRGVSTVLASLRPSRGRAPDADLEAVRHAAATLLEVDADVLQHVATTRVPAALPRPGLPELAESTPPGVVLAGDHLAEPSIEEAVESGIHAATSILAA